MRCVSRSKSCLFFLVPLPTLNFGMFISPMKNCNSTMLVSSWADSACCPGPWICSAGQLGDLQLLGDVYFTTSPQVISYRNLPDHKLYRYKQHVSSWLVSAVLPNPFHPTDTQYFVHFSFVDDLFKVSLQILGFRPQMKAFQHRSRVPGQRARCVFHHGHYPETDRTPDSAREKSPQASWICLNKGNLWKF